MNLREGARNFLVGDGQKAILSSDYAAGPVLHNNSPGQRLSQRAAKTHLSAYGGAEAIDWVMDAVGLISETASNAEYHFEKDGDKLVAQATPESKSADLSEAPQDLVKLLKNPNPWMDYTEMIELTVIDFLLAGNSYWLKYNRNNEGKPQALYRLAPPLITVVPGKTAPIDHYEYLPPGQAQPISFQPEEVVHFKRANPHSEHFGLGVIAGGPEMFDVEIAMTKSQRGYFQRGTRLTGVIMSERAIPIKIWNKIVREFRNAFQGNDNAWDVAALERGMTYKPLSATAAEAEFRYLGPLSRDRILAAFRVPGSLIGVVDNEQGPTMKESQRNFDNKTMRPFLNKLQTAITKSLTDAWNVDFKIDYEYVLPIEDKFQLAQDFAVLPGVRVREVREQVGLQPLGDERDEIVLNLPGEDGNASTVKDQPLAGEPGRPPDGSNTAAFPKPGQPLPADAQARRGGPNAALAARVSQRRTNG